MENEFMKRGYLLPDGCKDLIDVLKRPKHPFLFFGAPKFKQLGYLLNPQILKLKPEHTRPEPLVSLPPINGEVVIADQATVTQLAMLLGQKVCQIIADVMELGFYVTDKDSLSFQIISSVARKYGFVAKLSA